MNYVNDYKKFKGEIITINHVIISKEHNNPTEIIQGKLVEVNDNNIVIDQYLPYYDFVVSGKATIMRRSFKYGQFNPMFNFRH